ncbi:poly-beta-1,6-N-acetyl-D-glucosamine biosynthesis protein PgaD [Cognatilysobacter bugurensis]|uniref:Poly-beta-1,6-N-acetyl-D-glucosamine biosynthesis protein PgaD n=1 Tax=Cognatilysobacter bugurensis TaxID=543356 RepID=A0A918W6H4_9GAMM|nr:poly-beta-1,6-N-acetyl-D-glucosamine biosynthesis protein PgaD [Lysobacter bugurensis]GHA73575.1 hypothetical protein GCM10007067_07930 [Lysobacter bugurensis]
MKHEGFLIQNAGLQPRLYRTAWGMVTLGFWVAYLYLWLPAATLAMWAAGVRLAVMELYLHQHKIDVFLLSVLPLLAVMTGVLLIGWAEINRVWFVGKERRGQVPNVSIDRVAAALQTPQPIAHALQELKIAVLQMDTDAIPYMVVDGAPQLIPAAQPTTMPDVVLAPLLPAVEA